MDVVTESNHMILWLNINKRFKSLEGLVAAMDIANRESSHR